MRKTSYILLNFFEKKNVVERGGAKSMAYGLDNFASQSAILHACKCITATYSRKGGAMILAKVQRNGDNFIMHVAPNIYGTIVFVIIILITLWKL